MVHISKSFVAKSGKSLKLEAGRFPWFKKSEKKISMLLGLWSPLDKKVYFVKLVRAWVSSLNSSLVDRAWH